MDEAKRQPSPAGPPLRDQVWVRAGRQAYDMASFFPPDRVGRIVGQVSSPAQEQIVPVWRQVWGQVRGQRVWGEECEPHMARNDAMAWHSPVETWLPGEDRIGKGRHG